MKLELLDHGKSNLNPTLKWEDHEGTGIGPENEQWKLAMTVRNREFQGKVSLKRDHQTIQDISAPVESQSSLPLKKKKQEKIDSIDNNSELCK